MIPSNTQTEVTSVETTSASSAKPAVSGEVPQTVYEKKKTIFRFSQVIWYVLGLMEVLLAFRFVFRLLGANAATGFVSFIYSITNLMVMPFRGIFPVAAAGGSVLEWSTLIAAFVYLCVAWALVYLLDLVYPITPEDVGV